MLNSLWTLTEQLVLCKFKWVNYSSFIKLLKCNYKHNNNCWNISCPRLSLPLKNVNEFKLKTYRLMTIEFVSWCNIISCSFHLMQHCIEPGLQKATWLGTAKRSWKPISKNDYIQSNGKGKQIKYLNIDIKLFHRKEKSYNST